MHQSIGVELPVLVAVRAKPIARIVMPLKGEADLDPASFKNPQFLDQPIVQLLPPFAGEELDDRRPALEKFRPIAPPAIYGICQRYLFRVTTVSPIFSPPPL